MSKINGEIAVLPKETHLRAIHYTGDNLEDVIEFIEDTQMGCGMEAVRDCLITYLTVDPMWLVREISHLDGPMMRIYTDEEFKLRFQMMEQRWGLYEPICGYWAHSDGNYRECPSFPYWNEKQAVEDAKLLDCNPGGREVEVVSEWFRIGSDEN